MSQSRFKPFRQPRRIEVNAKGEKGMTPDRGVALRPRGHRKLQYLPAVFTSRSDRQGWHGTRLNDSAGVNPHELLGCGFNDSQ